MTETAQHTPGPWFIMPSFPTTVWAGNADIIISDRGGTDPTETANARLIAAAPELLTALKIIHETWNGPSMTADEFFSFMAESAPLIRAAIAKAEGRS